MAADPINVYDSLAPVYGDGEQGGQWADSN